MDSEVIEIILQKWLDSSDIDKSKFLQILSTIRSNLNDNNLSEMRWNDQPRFPGNSSYPWGNRPLFNRPNTMQQPLLPLPHFFQFPGPPQRFLEPRMPPPRMPFYQPPHRALPTAFGPRPGTPRQPFHRNHPPPRRRHHLDDIFLPNHDDEEYPEAGFRSRYSRPPVRFEIRTTHSETVTRPSSATTSNARTPSENVSDPKSHEKTVINSNHKTKDKLELGKKSESDKLNVQQSNNILVKITNSDNDKPLLTTINDGKSTTKTCKDQHASSHEKVVESDPKVKSIDKAKLNQNNEPVKSNVQSVVNNSNSSKAFCASKTVVTTTNDKKNETKTNNAKSILNREINLATSKELHKKNETQSKDNPIRKSISKNVDINNTKTANCQSELNVDKVPTKPSTCSLEKEKITHQKTDDLQSSQNILNKTKVSDSTNNQTKCKEQIVNSNIKKGSAGNQIEKQVKGVIHTNTSNQTKSIFKPTNDTLENGNYSFSPKDKSSKDIIDRRASLDSKPQVKKIAHQNSSIFGNKVSESKPNVTNKSVKVQLFKNDVQDKDHEKLQNKNCLTDTITKTAIQRISNSNNDKMIKKADKPKDVQESTVSPEKNIDNIDKASTVQLKNVESNTSQICIKEQTSSDSEIDIVTELEALVNKRDDYALRENKITKEKEIGNKPLPKDKNVNSSEQRKSLEEESLTQGTTRVVAPSSPQAIKKDIIIKLIRSPQPKSPLVAKSPPSKDLSAPCNRPPVPTSPLTNSINKHVKKSDVHTDRQHIIKHSRVSGSDNSNIPILEDIFILEDALKIIDNPTEIIEVPSSPPNKDDTTDDDSNINRRAVKDNEITDLEDVQIIEQHHATIEIVDDDSNDDVHLLSPSPNDCHNKSTSSIVVIKDESPVNCERISKSSTWHDRSPEDFGTLDTRGSFLYTFHQRFDDPRVVDMDLCHTPSPPAKSAQQRESDRVIRDMDALWNQISDNKYIECSSSSSHRSKDGKGMIESDKDLTLSQTNNKKVKKCQQIEELKNTAIENQYGQGHNTRVICANQDLIAGVQDTFNKKVKRFAGATNRPRRASFSHKNSNINSSNLSLRKIKSLSDIASIITVDYDFSIAPALGNVIPALKNAIDNEGSTHTKTTRTEANLLQNIISESSCHRKSSELEPSFVANYTDQVSSLLPSSAYKDQRSDKNICVNHIARNESGISKKLDVIPKTIPNNLITADGTDDSDVSIHTKRKGIKDIKKKRVRRIDSSDEESTEATARILKKDEPKQKKQKLQVKPTRKRKISLDGKAKNKEYKKFVKASRTSPVSGERQAQTSKTEKSAALSRTKGNQSSPERPSVPATQPLTKYVTKAEYIKSFARSHSLIPNISLSIQPITKTQKITQRRATFTCEADNETILKKVDGGERCKQKFRDLFGSVSEDEEDLIQAPSTKVGKTPCEADKKVEETRITPEASIPNTQSTKKDCGKKRKRCSKPFIEEPDSPDPKTVLLSDHNLPKVSKTLKDSKMPDINSNKESDSCKRLKIQNEPPVPIDQKISDEIRQIKNRETETTSGKLKRQNSNKNYKTTNVDNNKDSNKKLSLDNRRESTSSTDSRSKDSSCQAFREEKKSLDKTEIKTGGRISRSRSKESDSSRKAINIDNDNKDSNKKLDLDSRSKDSSLQTFREEKKSPDKTQVKTDKRISRSRSKESDSSRKATKNVDNDKDSNKKIDLSSRRESTSSTDSRSKDSSCQAFREEKKSINKTQIKTDRRISRSRSKESESSSKPTKNVNNDKDSNKNLDLSSRRESTSSTDSRSKDSSCQVFREEKKSLDKTQIKTDRRISRSRSKESDLSRKATNVVNDNKDSNKKLVLGSRRESTSSTNSRSRHSSYQALREENKSPKTQIKTAGRISRSPSNESDSSRITDADKNVSKNDHSKQEKRERALNERRFDNDCNKSLKFEEHASKGLTLQQERTDCDYRRDSTSSVESNTSGLNRSKKESIDKEMLKSTVHRRKSLSNDKTIRDGSDKETSNVALNQKHDEVKKTTCTDRGSSRAVIKTREPTKEAKNENVTEHKGYPKPGLDEKNKEYNYKRGTKTFTKRKSLLVEKSDSFDKHVTEPSTKTSLIEHEEQRKLEAQKPTDIKGTVSPIKRIMESFRRNSSPDVLSSSSETSLIIGEIEDLPLLYRASEDELNEQFHICQAFITHVTKRDKITKFSVVDVECIDRVHISDPPEISTDAQTIKQAYKEDDDVIEIRPVIPMIDLTEEDIRINREISPKDTLPDLMIEAKKEIEELSQDHATITLYRSEEDDSNQDQEVQAIAASIPSILQKNNYSQIKKDTDLLQQEATIATTSGVTLQASSINTSNNKEITVFDNNLNPSITDVEKETPEAASPAAPQLLVQSHETIVENSLPRCSNVQIPQPPTAIPPSSLEAENQRAVSSILGVQHNNSSRVITDSVNDLQCNTNQSSTVLQGTFETLNVNTVNESLNIANFEPTEQDNNFEKQNDTVENPNTISEPHEVSQALPIDGTGFDKDKRPRVIVRPTIAENNIDVDSRILNLRQDQMIQEDLFGQHKGLPQTLREYRPIRRVRVTGVVVPPALVNINLSRTSPQKKNYKRPTKQTSSQNVRTSPTQNTEVDINQTTRQIARAPENDRLIVDLTHDNGELPPVDLRLIVDIFTRHAFFLAHLCEAQKGYMEYLQKRPFCQNYFRAEIALFEEQRQARLLSQSLRLITELQSLNIRATRNLSASASEIVEQIAVNLVNREMPTQVTKSMVYFLVAKLIKPQSDMFSRVPLLKALIRICNVVLSRIVSRYPNLSEDQRLILTQQVNEYNRLFGGPSWPPNQVNTSLGSVRPNFDQSTYNPHTTDVQSKNKSVRSVQGNQSLLRNTLPMPRSRDDILDNQVNSPSGQSGLPPMNNPLSANVRQPTINSNDLSPIIRLEHQFGSPRQSHFNSSGGSVIETRNVYSGPTNLSSRVTTQTESLAPVYQASIGPNLMTSPNGNHMTSPNGNHMTSPNGNLMTFLNGNRIIPPNVNVSMIRQHRFSSPRQSSPFVVPNKSRQMNSVRDLPGGANTNTLGSTPRYLPNYNKSIPSNVYAPLGRPRHSSAQTLDSVSRNTNLLNSCPPPSSSNSQVTRGILSNQNSLDLHTSNSILSSLLADSNSSSQGHSIVQQTSVPSPGRLPSYEESIALQSIHQPSSSSPNPLPPDEAKKRNENLLKELLSTPDDPFFGRSSSPANDNFRIKLPFTQPDITRSITTSANNTLSTFNDNESFSTCQSNMQVSSTGVATIMSQAPNITPASNLITVVVTSPQPIMQNNPVIVCPPPIVQCHQPNMISLSSQSVTSLAPIVWVNNTVASTSYVVAQPKQTIILNQGLEALSSIGPASAMLNFPSNYLTNSQSNTNNVSITSIQNSLQNQVLSITNQPLLQSSDALQTVAPIAILNNSNVSQSQNPSCININAVRGNQTYASIQPRPSLPYVPATEVDEGKTSALDSQVKKCKPISKQPPKKTTKRAKPKPKSETKSKPQKKRGRAGNRKKGPLTKVIEIIDLLSSDEDMTSENQSGEEDRAIEEAEVTTDDSEQYSVNNQIATMQQPCGSKASVSTSDTQNQDQEPRGDKDKSSNLPTTRTEIEDLQPSTFNSSNHLEGASGTQIQIEDVQPSTFNSSNRLDSTSSTRTQIEDLQPSTFNSSNRLEGTPSTQTEIEDLQPSTFNSSNSLDGTPSTRTEIKDLQPSTFNSSNRLEGAPSTPTQIEDLQSATLNSSNRLEGTNEGDEVEAIIDLTWIDELDDQELQREMDFVFIKKEEPRDENEETQEQNNMVVPSPADSGISSPPCQSEDDTTVYTVNVQRLCICSKTAQYNCACEEAWYCGQDCQLNDWSSHQKVCQIYHEAMETEEDSMVNEQENDTHDETT